MSIPKATERKSKLTQTMLGVRFTEALRKTYTLIYHSALILCRTTAGGTLRNTSGILGSANRVVANRDETGIAD
jgi:hypothetical protein